MKYTPLLLLAFSQIVLNVILLYRRHDRVSRVFTYFTLLLLLWTSINIFLDYNTTHVIASSSLEGGLGLVNILNKAGFVTGSIILMVLYQSVVVSQGLPGSRSSRKVLVLGAGLAIACLFPVFSGSYDVYQGTYRYHYGPASLLFLPYLLMLAGYAIKIVIARLKSNQTLIERKQTLTVMAALFLSAIWGLIFIILIPTITKNDQSIFIGYLAPYIFTILMYYAIIWLGLLNFRQIIARSIGYILSLAALSSVFIVITQLVVHYILRGSITNREALLFSFISFATALLFRPAKQYFDRLTNRIFYRDAYDSEEVFNKLSRALVSVHDIRDLLDEVSAFLGAELKFTNVHIQLKEYRATWPSQVAEKDVVSLHEVYESLAKTLRVNENVVVAELIKTDTDTKLKNLLHVHDISAVVRLAPVNKQAREVLGYISLGQKRSGGMYTTQDISVLQAIANEVSLAVQNVLHFEEIQHFNVTLQERVEEQTRKYRTANEKLKKLDETKDEFISMASHQLRTPLTSVKGYLSMVLEGDAGPLKPQQEQLLKQSFMSSQRMVNLIADLLNLSRLNTGKFVIETAPTDLRVIVDQEIAQLHETAKAKNITLTYVNPKTFSLLPLDEGKIHQVVMNFIDNAIYYTPEGGQIEVSLNETPSHIEFRVQDSGIGVPREMQHKLFGKFYRADNARRMRPDGTGLGLYMAKKVVVAQGGSIIFASQEGKGSTFGFRFSKRHVTTHNQTLPSEKA